MNAKKKRRKVASKKVIKKTTRKQVKKTKKVAKKKSVIVHRPAVIAAFEKGVAAREGGQPIETCPYPRERGANGMYRNYWIKGFNGLGINETFVDRAPPPAKKRSVVPKKPQFPTRHGVEIISEPDENWFEMAVIATLNLTESNLETMGFANGDVIYTSVHPMSGAKNMVSHKCAVNLQGQALEKALSWVRAEGAQMRRKVKIFGRVNFIKIPPGGYKIVNPSFFANDIQMVDEKMDESNG